METGETMRATNKKPWRGQRGFTIIEMMVATVLMLVGLVAVAQLVPAALLLNGGNQDDSIALVLAQSEMDQFIGQPLSTFLYTDPAANPCNPCDLGNGAAAGAWAGSPLLAVNNQQVINFAAAPVGGYNFTWADPNDPSGRRYDVRWAVFPFANGSGRRFIIGARRVGGNAAFVPVTIDSMVEK